MTYSPERKAAVLTKMLSPNNMPLGRLTKEERISAGTLVKCRADPQLTIDVKTLHAKIGELTM